VGTAGAGGTGTRRDGEVAWCLERDRDSREALAGVLDALERFSESEPLYWQAWRVYQRAYREERHQIATTLLNLGYLKASTGNAQEAEVPCAVPSATPSRKESCQPDS